MGKILSSLQRYSASLLSRVMIAIGIIIIFLLLSYQYLIISKELGNVVANHEELTFSKVKEKYEGILQKALQKSPTAKSHSNTLYHISGHFRDVLPSIEKQFVKRSIEDFTAGKISLNQILGTLKFLTSKFDGTYLSRQTYFLLYSDST